MFSDEQQSYNIQCKESGIKPGDAFHVRVESDAIMLSRSWTNFREIENHISKYVKIEEQQPPYSGNCCSLFFIFKI